MPSVWEFCRVMSEAEIESQWQRKAVALWNALSGWCLMKRLKAAISRQPRPFLCRRARVPVCLPPPVTLYFHLVNFDGSRHHASHGRSQSTHHSIRQRLLLAAYRCEDRGRRSVAKLAFDPCLCDSKLQSLTLRPQM